MALLFWRQKLRQWVWLQPSCFAKCAFIYSRHPPGTVMFNMDIDKMENASMQP